MFYNIDINNLRKTNSLGESVYKIPIIDTFSVSASVPEITSVKASKPYIEDNHCFIDIPYHNSNDSLVRKILQTCGDPRVLFG